MHACQNKSERASAAAAPDTSGVKGPFGPVCLTGETATFKYRMRRRHLLVKRGPKKEGSHDVRMIFEAAASASPLVGQPRT